MKFHWAKNHINFIGNSIHDYAPSSETDQSNWVNQIHRREKILTLVFDTKHDLSDSKSQSNCCCHEEVFRSPHNPLAYEMRQFTLIVHGCGVGVCMETVELSSCLSSYLTRNT